MAERDECDLMATLRARVGRFVRRRAHYKTPLLQFFSVLEQNEWPAVIFGGTLRDLMIRGSSEQPRDVDVVVDVPTIEQIAHVFQSSIRKQTRFGGLHLTLGSWPIDIWPLASTWAFQGGRFDSLHFDSLPSTTFLNVEAAAVEVWPEAGRARRVYERQFFDALSSRTVEVNLAENPFPELCVVRALVTAARLDFSIGPKLKGYIRTHGCRLSERNLEDVQIGHYGKVRCLGAVMKTWIELIAPGEGADTDPVRLPVDRPTQLSLWEDWNPSC